MPADGRLRSAQSSPCAGCKFLRRKCPPDCVFAPYFPANQQQKFVDVHRVFGASNVGKILAGLLPHEREEAATSLVYEAQMRLSDPTEGCLGIVRYLQRDLLICNTEIACAYAELSSLESMVATGFQMKAASQVSATQMDELFLPDWMQQQQQQRMMMMAGGENYSNQPPYTEPAAVYASDSTVAMVSSGNQLGMSGGGDEVEEWFDGLIF